jgi:AcrR family transcriptional regulator
VSRNGRDAAAPPPWSTRRSSTVSRPARSVWSSSVLANVVEKGEGGVVKKKRGQYHHGALATSAIEAAAREIDAHGHQGFTLEKVAKRLGVSPSALYRHFENREALLRAFMWETFLRFVAILDGEVAAATTPTQVLHALGRVYVDFALDEPGWFRLQFSQAGIAMDLQHTDAQPQYPGIVLDALGTLLGDDQQLVESWYLGIWALGHGVASLSLEGVWAHVKTKDERRAQAERILRAQLHALEQISQRLR